LVGLFTLLAPFNNETVLIAVIKIINGNESNRSTKDPGQQPFEYQAGVGGNALKIY
jgi:hypothetical protein